MAFTLSFRRVLILLVTLSINLCHLQVSAEPLRYGLHKRVLVPTAAQCDRHMNLPANTALFWTQSTKHNEFADQNNLYTLEKACGYYVDSDHKSSPLYPTASLTRSTGAPVWDALSHAMAVAAKGTVYVMKGPGAEAKPTSTWNRIEFPALKANREVTSIIELSDDATKLTDGHVIWSVSKTPPGSQPGSQPGSPKDLSKVSPVGKSSSLPASPKGLPAKVLHRRNLLQAVRASQGYY